MQETDSGGVYPELLSMEDFLREEKVRPEEVGEEVKRIAYSFASIPFDEKSSRLYNIWRALYFMIFGKRA